MIAIALAYFFAGFQKWRYSGFAWVTSDNLRWILYAHVAIQIALGLDYSAQWLTVLIVFVNWPVVVEWTRRILVPTPAPREIAR